MKLVSKRKGEVYIGETVIFRFYNTVGFVSISNSACITFN